MWLLAHALSALEEAPSFLLFFEFVGVLRWVMDIFWFGQYVAHGSCPVCAEVSAKAHTFNEIGSVLQRHKSWFLDFGEMWLLASAVSSPEWALRASSVSLDVCHTGQLLTCAAQIQKSPSRRSSIREHILRRPSIGESFLCWSRKLESLL